MGNEGKNKPADEERVRCVVKKVEYKPADDKFFTKYREAGETGPDVYIDGWLWLLAVDKPNEEDQWELWVRQSRSSKGNLQVRFGGEPMASGTVVKTKSGRIINAILGQSPESAGVPLSPTIQDLQAYVGKRLDVLIAHKTTAKGTWVNADDFFTPLR